MKYRTAMLLYSNVLLSSAPNIGQAVYSYFSAQLVYLLMAVLACFGVYIFVTRKVSQIASVIAVGILAVGLIIFTDTAIDLLGRFFNTFSGL